MNPQFPSRSLELVNERVAIILLYTFGTDGVVCKQKSIPSDVSPIRIQFLANCPRRSFFSLLCIVGVVLLAIHVGLVVPCKSKD